MEVFIMNNYLVGQKRIMDASKLFMQAKSNEREVRHIFRK